MLGEVRFTDLDFCIDAAMFAETARAFILFLEALAVESEHLKLHVSWTKANPTVLSRLSIQVR